MPWWQVTHCTWMGGFEWSSSVEMNFSLILCVICIITRAVFFSSFSSLGKSRPCPPAFCAWQAPQRTPSARVKPPMIARSSSWEMSLGSTFRFWNFSASCAAALWNPATRPPARTRAASKPYGVIQFVRFIHPPLGCEGARSAPLEQVLQLSGRQRDREAAERPVPSELAGGAREPAPGGARERATDADPAHAECGHLGDGGEGGA